MAKAMKDKGGAEWGIALGTKNWQEYLPFVWSNGGDVMDDDGTFTLDSPQAVEALTFYNSFFEEGLTPKSVPEGFDITPAFVAGHAPDVLLRPVAPRPDQRGRRRRHRGQVGDRADARQEGAPATSFVGGSNLVVFKDSDEQGRGLGVRRVPVRARRRRSKWYETVDRPAGRPGRLGRPGAQGRPERRDVRRAAQGHQGPAGDPDLERDRDRDQRRRSRRSRPATCRPQDAAEAMQEEATSIGTGSSLTRRADRSAGRRSHRRSSRAPGAEAARPPAGRPPARGDGAAGPDRLGVRRAVRDPLLRLPRRADRRVAAC